MKKIEALARDPLEVAAGLRHLPGLVFFDSARRKGQDDPISIIAANPSEIVRGQMDTDWERLSKLVREHGATAASEFGLPHGFVAGLIEYDGAFHFGLYEDALFYQHGTGEWFEHGDLASHLCQAHPVGAQATFPLPFRPEISAAEYATMVRRAQGFIAAGDIYQVNLAHRFQAPLPALTHQEQAAFAFSFYEALRRASPAPYAAYLDLGQKQILSTSPESFLRLSGRHARTRPIKGTRPRLTDPLADERSARELLHSSKEAAELVMITDLERNDLGQVSTFGSVTVRELLALERFEQVFHLVSTVESELRPGLDHPTALRACFPGGSITGAPKKRAREIIAELEPVPRGAYTGALGWFGFNEESQFNIAIRTVVVEPGVAHFHVGAGIVADSVAEQEHQETLDKAAGILLAAERWSGEPRNFLAAETRAASSIRLESVR